jgi:hypothetical protein
MQISRPHQHGVLDAATNETIARHGRSTADIHVARCDDGLYRFSIAVHYSYGGFCGPIHESDPGFSTLDAARIAALEELLQRWPKPFPSDPQSVHDELAAMRHQVASRIRQPSLF